MTVKVEITKKTYTLQNLEWSGDDQNIANMLKRSTDLYLEMTEITPDQGDPDYVIAQHIAKMYSGRVIEYIDDELYPDDVVF